MNGPDGRIHLLRTSDLSPVSEANWSIDSLRSLDISFDGRYVVTASDPREVRVWDTEDVSEPLHTLADARGTLGQVTMSQDQDATRLAVTTSEGMVYVWDRASGKLLAAMRRHADAADEATFDPNDIDHMFSAGDDGFMVSYTCEVCALGADELKDAAEDRLAQGIDLDD